MRKKELTSKVKLEQDAKVSSVDELIKTDKSGDIELDEEELGRISGGALGPYLKIGGQKSGGT
jgi:hypothetical protein